MKISVLITLIAATIVVGISGTFNERPGAVELRGRKGGSLEPRLQTTPWRIRKIAQAKTKLRTIFSEQKNKFNVKLRQAQQAARTRSNRREVQVRSACSTGFRPTWQLQCPCNFAGAACDPKPNEVLAHARAYSKILKNIAPKGLQNMALAIKSATGALTTNVKTICEGENVAVLYDCNARSPLYAATVINGANFNKEKLDIKRKNKWRTTMGMTLSESLASLAANRDYQGSSEHSYCFEDDKGKCWNWDGTTSCTLHSPPKIKIHRGHLIAANYGKTHGTQLDIDVTFSYTNSVPQEGSFNSGKWRVAEQELIEKAKICQENAESKQADAEMYVVVGVIPSSFLGKPRFFGSGGFGSYQDKKGKYRISFPEIMWTAACCIHTDGSFGDKFGFWRRNEHSSEVVNKFDSLTEMFKAIENEISQTWGKDIDFKPPTVFPSFPDCNE